MENMKELYIHTPQMPTFDGVDAEFHNRVHAQCLVMGMGTAALAAIIGFELYSIQENLKHGEWLPWIKEHCRFSVDTARRYQKAALNVSGQIADKIPQRLQYLRNELPDLSPSTMSKKELEDLQRNIFEAIGGISLNMLLHASDDPQNHAEAIVCNGVAATLPGVSKKAGKRTSKTAKHAVMPERLTKGFLTPFREMWSATEAPVKHAVLDEIGNENLAIHLGVRGYLVTKLDLTKTTKPTK